MIKKLIITGASVSVLYLCSYIGFRMMNVETWEKNGKDYVIFPQKGIALYYLFRPLSYIDAKLTGVGAHIGPHQE